jgi:hypothetical protein
MMRPMIFLFAAPLALVARPATVTAQGSFEGVVHYDMTGPNGQTVQPVYYVKGAKTRMVMSAGGQEMVMLMDNDAGKWMALMPQQKMYMTMDLGAMAERMPKSDTPGATPEFTLEATGKTETIAGISCDDYHLNVAEKGTEADLCVAKGMGYFMGMSAPSRGGMMGRMGDAMSGNMPSGWQQYARALEGGAFLLRMEMRKGGKTQMSMVATDVEKKPLDDDLFAPPSDYREMKMPGMPGGE